MNSPARGEGQAPRRIVLCADDFGMNPAVNAGVLALAHTGRLSATSVLVDGPALQADVAALKDSGLQIGLHLNLTESFGQRGFWQPLRTLIVNTALRRVSPAVLRAEVRRQLDAFHACFGRPPDYVDGHQHVHQFAGVRDALLAELAACSPRPRWIRDTSRQRSRGLPWRLRLKARVIATLGGAALRRRARAAGFSLNGGFLGVYDFQGGEAAYARWLRCWLDNARDGDVLMCHPAQGGGHDALAVQRAAECRVLADPAMVRWLADRQLISDGARAPGESS